MIESRATSLSDAYRIVMMCEGASTGDLPQHQTTTVYAEAEVAQGSFACYDQLSSLVTLYCSMHGGIIYEVGATAYPMIFVFTLDMGCGPWREPGKPRDASIEATLSIVSPIVGWTPRRIRAIEQSCEAVSLDIGDAWFKVHR